MSWFTFLSPPTSEARSSSSTLLSHITDEPTEDNLVLIQHAWETIPDNHIFNHEIIIKLTRLWKKSRHTLPFHRVHDLISNIFIFAISKHNFILLHTILKLLENVFRTFLSIFDHDDITSIYHLTPVEYEFILFWCGNGGILLNTLELTTATCSSFMVHFNSLLHGKSPHYKIDGAADNDKIMDQSHVPNDSVLLEYNFELYNDNKIQNMLFYIHNTSITILSALLKANTLNNYYILPMNNVHDMIKGISQSNDPLLDINPDENHQYHEDSDDHARNIPTKLKKQHKIPVTSNTTPNNDYSGAFRISYQKYTSQKEEKSNTERNHINPITTHILYHFPITVDSLLTNFTQDHANFIKNVLQHKLNKVLSQHDENLHDQTDDMIDNRNDMLYDNIISFLLSIIYYDTVSPSKYPQLPFMLSHLYNTSILENNHQQYTSNSAPEKHPSHNSTAPQKTHISLKSFAKARNILNIDNPTNAPLIPNTITKTYYQIILILTQSSVIVTLLNIVLNKFLHNVSTINTYIEQNILLKSPLRNMQSETNFFDYLQSSEFSTDIVLFYGIITVLSVSPECISFLLVNNYHNVLLGDYNDQHQSDREKMPKFDSTINGIGGLNPGDKSTNSSFHNTMVTTVSPPNECFDFLSMINTILNVINNDIYNVFINFGHTITLPLFTSTSLSSLHDALQTTENPTLSTPSNETKQKQQLTFYSRDNIDNIKVRLLIYILNIKLSIIITLLNTLTTLSTTNFSKVHDFTAILQINEYSSPSFVIQSILSVLLLRLVQLWRNDYLPVVFKVFLVSIINSIIHNNFNNIQYLLTLKVPLGITYDSVGIDVINNITSTTTNPQVDEYVYILGNSFQYYNINYLFYLIDMFLPFVDYSTAITTPIRNDNDHQPNTPTNNNNHSPNSPTIMSTTPQRPPHTANIKLVYLLPYLTATILDHNKKPYYLFSHYKSSFLNNDNVYYAMIYNEQLHNNVLISLYTMLFSAHHINIIPKPLQPTPDMNLTSHTTSLVSPHDNHQQLQPPQYSSAVHLSKIKSQTMTTNSAQNSLHSIIDFTTEHLLEFGDIAMYLVLSLSLHNRPSSQHPQNNHQTTLDQIQQSIDRVRYKYSTFDELAYLIQQCPHIDPKSLIITSKILRNGLSSIIFPKRQTDIHSPLGLKDFFTKYYSLLQFYQTLFGMINNRPDIVQIIVGNYDLNAPQRNTMFSYDDGDNDGEVHSELLVQPLWIYCSDDEYQWVTQSLLQSKLFSLQQNQFFNEPVPDGLKTRGFFTSFLSHIFNYNSEGSPHFGHMGENDREDVETNKYPLLIIIIAQFVHILKELRENQAIFNTFKDTDGQNTQSFSHLFLKNQLLNNVFTAILNVFSEILRNNLSLNIILLINHILSTSHTNEISSAYTEQSLLSLLTEIITSSFTYVEPFYSDATYDHHTPTPFLYATEHTILTKNVTKNDKNNDILQQLASKHFNRFPTNTKTNDTPYKQDKEGISTDQRQDQISKIDLVLTPVSYAMVVYFFSIINDSISNILLQYVSQLKDFLNNKSKTMTNCISFLKQNDTIINSNTIKILLTINKERFFNVNDVNNHFTSYSTPQNNNRDISNGSLGPLNEVVYNNRYFHTNTVNFNNIAVINNNTHNILFYIIHTLVNLNKTLKLNDQNKGFLAYLSILYSNTPLTSLTLLNNQYKPTFYSSQFNSTQYCGVTTQHDIFQQQKSTLLSSYYYNPGTLTPSFLSQSQALKDLNGITLNHSESTTSFLNPMKCITTPKVDVSKHQPNQCTVTQRILNGQSLFQTIHFNAFVNTSQFANILYHYFYNYLYFSHMNKFKMSIEQYQCDVSDNNNSDDNDGDVDEDLTKKNRLPLQSDYDDLLYGHLNYSAIYTYLFDIIPPDDGGSLSSFDAPDMSEQNILQSGILTTILPAQTTTLSSILSYNLSINNSLFVLFLSLFSLHTPADHAAQSFPISRQSPTVIAFESTANVLSHDSNSKSTNSNKNSVINDLEELLATQQNTIKTLQLANISLDTKNQELLSELSQIVEKNTAMIAEILKKPCLKCENYERMLSLYNQQYQSSLNEISLLYSLEKNTNLLLNNNYYTILTSQLAKIEKILQNRSTDNLITKTLFTIKSLITTTTTNITTLYTHFTAQIDERIEKNHDEYSRILTEQSTIKSNEAIEHSLYYDLYLKTLSQSTEKDLKLNELLQTYNTTVTAHNAALLSDEERYNTLFAKYQELLQQNEQQSMQSNTIVQSIQMMEPLSHNQVQQQAFDPTTTKEYHDLYHAYLAKSAEVEELCTLLEMKEDSQSNHATFTQQEQVDVQNDLQQPLIQHTNQDQPLDITDQNHQDTHQLECHQHHFDQHSQVDIVNDIISCEDVLEYDLHDVDAYINSNNNDPHHVYHPQDFYNVLNQQKDLLQIQQNPHQFPFQSGVLSTSPSQSKALLQTESPQVSCVYNASAEPSPPPPLLIEVVDTSAFIIGDELDIDSADCDGFDDNTNLRPESDDHMTSPVYQNLLEPELAIDIDSDNLIGLVDINDDAIIPNNVVEQTITTPKNRQIPELALSLEYVLDFQHECDEHHHLAIQPTIGDSINLTDLVIHKSIDVTSDDTSFGVVPHHSPPHQDIPDFSSDTHVAENDIGDISDNTNITFIPPHTSPPQFDIQSINIDFLDIIDDVAELNLTIDGETNGDIVLHDQVHAQTNPHHEETVKIEQDTSQVYDIDVNLDHIVDFNSHSPTSSTELPPKKPHLSTDLITPPPTQFPTQHVVRPAMIPIPSTSPHPTFSNPLLSHDSTDFIDEFDISIDASDLNIESNNIISEEIGISYDTHINYSEFGLPNLELVPLDHKDNFSTNITDLSVPNDKSSQTITSNILAQVFTDLNYQDDNIDMISEIGDLGFGNLVFDDDRVFESQFKQESLCHHFDTSSISTQTNTFQLDVNEINIAFGQYDDEHPPPTPKPAGQTRFNDIPPQNSISIDNNVLAAAITIDASSPEPFPNINVQYRQNEHSTLQLSPQPEETHLFNEDSASVDSFSPGPRNDRVIQLATETQQEESRWNISFDVGDDDYDFTSNLFG